MTLTAKIPWIIQDSGPLSAEENMAIDRAALAAIDGGLLREPVIRLFEWERDAVTFGYLLDPAKVKSWALTYGLSEIEKRPTGGGAVVHRTTDLSFSILWPRRAGFLPERPRACYEAIHRAVLEAVRPFFGGADLHVKNVDRCAGPPQAAGASRFSACFQEPVCNDVMVDGRKVVGGALRITRAAILYQGAIQTEASIDTDALKSVLCRRLPALLTDAGEAVTESTPAPIAPPVESVAPEPVPKTSAPSSSAANTPLQPSASPSSDAETAPASSAPPSTLAQRSKKSETSPDQLSWNF